MCIFFFSSRRRHTRCGRDWSSDVCSSDLERLLAVVRGPAPLGIDGPEGHMGEDDDRGAARELPHVVLEPLKLLGAQASETFGLVALHVDEADEVHAPVVEALPALAADRALAVA